MLILVQFEQFSLNIFAVPDGSVQECWTIDLSTFIKENSALAKTHNKLSRIRYSRHVILGHTCKIISHPRIAYAVINLQIVP
jgi:hypothetical protein